MSDTCTITGRLPRDLANAVSDAIHAALEKGMATDEAVCVVAAVAADYGRMEYGDGYLFGIAKVVLAKAGKPHPLDIGSAL